MRFTKTQILTFPGAFIATLLIFYTFTYFNSKSPNDFHIQFYVDGYNFHKLQFNDKDFSKYKVGDKIDLNKVQMTNGTPLLSATQEELLLFVVIAPDCPFCRISEDIVSRSRIEAKKSGVGYYSICFVQISSKSSLKKFSQSMGFEDSFLWQDESKPPQDLISIPTPAHFLTDRNGTILQVWFSSSRDEKIRERMSNQISSDLLIIKDVYKSVANSDD